MRSSQTVVRRLADWTPDQKVPDSQHTGGLNFRVAESALFTAPYAGKVIVTSAHPPGGM